MEHVSMISVVLVLGLMLLMEASAQCTAAWPAADMQADNVGASDSAMESSPGSAVDAAFSATDQLHQQKQSHTNLTDMKDANKVGGEWHAEQINSRRLAPCSITNCFACSGMKCGTCKSGYFLTDSGYTCTACTSPCATCTTTATTCNACIAGTYLSESSCVTSCPAGTYGDSTAKTCVSTCPNGTYGDGTTKTCVSTCPSSYYANSVTKLCAQCTSPCNTCSGSATTCTSCVSTTYLSSSSCVTTCPTGYADSTTKTCVTACPTGTFGDSATKTCVSTCPIGKYGDSTTKTCVTACPTGTFADSTTTTCVTGCPSGTFADSGSKTCVTACSTGYGDTTTKTCVTTCPTGSYGDSTSKTCVTACPSSYYANSVTKLCVQCTYPCSTCSGSATTCTSCVSTTYLSSSSCVTTCPTGYADSTTKTCVTTCASGTFADSASKACVTGCPTGYGDTTTKTCVTTCPTGTFGDSTMKTCVTACSSGYYANTGTKLCTKCDTPCTTCSGAGTTSCLTCADPSYLSGSSCVTTCPTGYFMSPPTRSCVQTCPSGYYADTTAKTCVQTCPSGYYGENTTKTCTVCSTSCLTCSGPTASQCLSCKTNTFLTSSNTCATACPPGYYTNTASGQCTQCDSTCATCSGGSATQCLSCGTPRFLSGTRCVTTCPAGTFGSDKNKRFCDACSTNCATCSSDSVTGCLTCKANTYSTASGSCLSADACQSLQGYISGSTCVQCDVSCATCTTTAKQCLSCPTGKYLLGTTCVTGDECKAQKGFAFGTSCLLCDVNCATCSGTATTCLTCPIDKPYLTSTSTCVAANTCLAMGGYTSGTFCRTCYSSCATCSGDTANSCLTCKTGNFLTSSNACVTADACQAQQGYVSSSNCVQCDVSCTTCTTTAKQCLSCPTSKYLLGTTCVTADECKAQKGFASGTSCLLCDVNCATCSGTATTCLTCPTDKPYLTSTSTCVAANICTAQGGYISDGNCLDCHSSCATCSGGSAYSCLTCPTTSFLTSGHACVTDCSAVGGYIDSATNSCKECSGACNRCTGPASSNCVACAPNYRWLDGQCVPDNYQGSCQDTIPAPGYGCVICHATKAGADMTLNYWEVKFADYSDWLNVHGGGQTAHANTNDGRVDFTLDPASCLGATNNMAYTYEDLAPRALDLRQCCYDVSATGDPWLVGFAGQRFFFDGGDDRWYSAISDTNVGLNLNMRMSRHLTSEGFIDGVGLTVLGADGLTRHTLSVTVGVDKMDFHPECPTNKACLGNGAVRIEVNGQVITDPGLVVLEPGYYITALNAPFACKKIPDAHWHWEEQIAHIREGRHAAANKRQLQAVSEDDEVKEKKLPVGHVMKTEAQQQQQSFSRELRAINAESNFLRTLLNEGGMFHQDICLNWVWDRVASDDLFAQRGRDSTIFIETPQLKLRVEYYLNLNAKEWVKHHRFDWFMKGYVPNPSVPGGHGIGGVLGETAVLKYDAVGQPILGDRLALLSHSEDDDYEVSGPFTNDFVAKPV